MTPRAGEDALSLVARFAKAVREREATVLKVLVFGRAEGRKEASNAMRRHLGEVEWPMTWVEGASCDGSPLAGIQAFAVRGAVVGRIALAGRVVGSVYEDGFARVCLLGGLQPTEIGSQRPDQATQVFDVLERALASAGFGLCDVVRTWFYNDRLLDWYGDFNRVRTALYSKTSFRSGSLPASTGISGRNPSGAALVAGALAFQPLSASARAFEVASPLQCPAPAYGSSFSRAMEIAAPGHRRLLVSGTASISLDGRSAWIGDAPRQVELTMKVVEAILDSRGFALADTTRAIAYFKQPGEAAAFDAWCSRRGFGNLPVIRTHCGICRDDLLFEIELDAAIRDG